MSASSTGESHTPVKQMARLRFLACMWLAYLACSLLSARALCLGEKRRVYTCCARTTDEDGCTRGHHVFYESDPEDLHKRHAFSHTRAANTDGPDTALDIVALDCEMIYTTGGMRVARVSVVDSTGKEVFDEFVRMDDGVEVMYALSCNKSPFSSYDASSDFNTRFSGITAENYATAVLQLSAIRRSLDALINSNTIIIGHALDNDLKTLRMVHHRCVDTVVMFPHRAGPPYRQALRHLCVALLPLVFVQYFRFPDALRSVKEHLGKIIQAGGGSVGHSSVEDSVATLDLVRWHILNNPAPPPRPSAAPRPPAGDAMLT